MDNDLRNRMRAPGGAPTDRAVRPQRISPPVAPRSVLPNDAPPPSRQPQPSRPDFAPPAGYKKTKKRGKGKKVLILLAVLLLLGASSAGAYWFRNIRNSAAPDPYSIGRGTPNPRNDQGAAQPVAAGTIRFIATGDMIAHDSVNENAKQADGSYDYLPFMDKMKPYFSKADIRFCNQATPAGGDKFGISGYPVFNAPVAFARGLEGVGCNLVNLGTNHTNDKGQPLIDAAVAAWDDRQGVLAVAGANRSAEEQNKVKIFTAKGLKFAFLSYTTYTNNKTVTPHGINMYNEATARSQIAEARQQADIIIVSMRWGTEYSPGINPEQETIAQTLADAGADVVLGHGPHVLEPVKKLKGKDGREALVWYSLGNFLNTQLKTESLIGGLAIMDIDVKTKKITKVSFMPTYMHYDWTAEQKRAEQLLARKNLTMVPLDQAADLLAKSQLNTTVQAQTDRVKTVLNQFAEVPIVTSSDY